MTENEIKRKLEDLFKSYLLVPEHVFATGQGSEIIGEYHNVLNNFLQDIAEIRAIKGLGMVTVLEGQDLKIPVTLSEIDNFDSIDSLLQWTKEIKFFLDQKKELEEYTIEIEHKLKKTALNCGKQYFHY